MKSIYEKVERKPKQKSGGQAVFLSLPPLMLYFFSVATVGIYDIFWLYRNWRAIKDATGEEISPFWRAVFGPIFFKSLIDRVYSNASIHGYSKPSNSTFFGLLYFFAALIGRGLSRYTPQDSNEGLLLLLSFVALLLMTPLFLLPTQYAINYNNKNLPKGEMRQRSSIWELLICAAGVVLLILNIVGYVYYLSPDTY